MIWLWVAAFVIFLIIEAATTQLVTLWFAIGSAAGFAACMFKLPVVWQFVIFAAVSAFALAATRPFVKKFMKKDFSPTNADRCIGQSALVTEDIDNRLEAGAVKINGTVWTARSENGEEIQKGESVIIKKIDGVKLIVTKKEENTL